MARTATRVSYLGPQNAETLSPPSIISSLTNPNSLSHSHSHSLVPLFSSCSSSSQKQGSEEEYHSQADRPGSNGKIVELLMTLNEKVQTSAAFVVPSSSNAHSENHVGAAVSQTKTSSDDNNDESYHENVDLEAMESGHKSGNSRHLRSHSEATIDEARLLTPGKKSDSSSSISSADSSLDDYIQVDRDKLSPSTADISGSTILNEDDQLATKDGEKDATGNSCLKSEQTDDGSTGPVAPEVCGLTSVFSLHSGSETKCRMQSPLIQVMERSGDSNSYRIPASVFARSKSTTLMEWSVASNESLFSLHVGNNSLSGDQVFLLSKSGELGKSGELTKSGELINFSPRLPLATAASEADKWSVGMGEGLGVTEAAAETMKGVLRATVEDHSKEKTPPDEGVRHSSSICHHFDGSGTSIQSIAFPMKFLASYFVHPVERRSVCGLYAAALMVVGCSATVRGQTAAVLTVVGCSAPVRSVAEQSVHGHSAAILMVVVAERSVHCHSAAVVMVVVAERSVHGHTPAVLMVIVAERSVHGHSPAVLMVVVAERSVHGHSPAVLMVVGHSAPVQSVAERSVHGHSAAVRVVVRRSTAVRGQTAALLTILGCSATVVTVAEEPASVLLCLPCNVFTLYLSIMMLPG
ncbi:hypothetical protein HHK36_029927 [Tetracentron sinense]|uniref:Uncharacterized protein n=1 Tax=Tetracentron sinense TaxID=13715 RepID=A0A835D268_TETSI|nr:hypothetical protein HHK36_029927 [Tetracentron sinense]